VCAGPWGQGGPVRSTTNAAEPAWPSMSRDTVEAMVSAGSPPAHEVGPCDPRSRGENSDEVRYLCVFASVSGLFRLQTDFEPRDQERAPPHRKVSHRRLTSPVNSC